MSNDNSPPVVVAFFTVIVPAATRNEGKFWLV